jgi:hypothetical protein
MIQNESVARGSAVSLYWNGEAPAAQVWLEVHDAPGVPPYPPPLRAGWPKEAGRRELILPRASRYSAITGECRQGAVPEVPRTGKLLLASLPLIVRAIERDWAETDGYMTDEPCRKWRPLRGRWAQRKIAAA